MREFFIIVSVLILLGVLMVLLAKTAVAFNMTFLLPFLYSIPFILMAYGNLKDARSLENLNNEQRFACRIRGYGFLLVIVPFFLKDVLPYFYIYSAALLLLSMIIPSFLEGKAQE